MRKRTLLPFTILFLLLLSLSVSAQDATPLEWLDIKLWPEFDDPRLLVIIDGQVSDPDQMVRIPVPAGASINAVASTSDDGRLVDNEWQSSVASDGSTIVSMTPGAPMFRVEYYVPLTTDGAGRMISFILPAGVFSTGAATLEMLLPPDSENIESQPAANSTDTLNDGTQMLIRQVGTVSAEEPIVQSLSYDNPTGALAMPEDVGPSPNIAAQASSQPEPSDRSSFASNPLLILLTVAAVLLIGAGIYGLWRTRSTAQAPAPRPDRRPPSKKASKEISSSSYSGKDKFCRKCGTNFKPDDRFCRNCGTKRE